MIGKTYFERASPPVTNPWIAELEVFYTLPGQRQQPVPFRVTATRNACNNRADRIRARREAIRELVKLTFP